MPELISLIFRCSEVQAFSSTIAVTSPPSLSRIRPYPVGLSRVVVISVAAAPDSVSASRSRYKVAVVSKGVSP
jgi:hypothetical protein